jgi:hypothetical protein
LGLAWPPSSLCNSRIARTPVHVMALLPLHASVAQSPHPSSHGQVMNDGVMEEMAVANSVTPGCIQRIYDQEVMQPGIIVQVLDSKKCGPTFRRHPETREALCDLLCF